MDSSITGIEERRYFQEDNKSTCPTPLDNSARTAGRKAGRSILHITNDGSYLYKDWNFMTGAKAITPEIKNNAPNIEAAFRFFTELQ